MFHNSIPVVMYHHVSPAGGGLNIMPDIFEDHLRMLSAKGWKALSGGELLTFLESGRVPGKTVLLTFDDGFADNYLFAYPLLKKFGMKAVLFVSSSFIEDEAVNRKKFVPLAHDAAWPLAFTERRSEVMCTWNELREMEESGVIEIQAHGHTHMIPAYIKEGRYRDVADDLSYGRRVLMEKLSKEVEHLAWPQGGYDERTVRIATDLGFKAIYTTELGLNTGESLTGLKRFPAKGGGQWLVNRLSIYSSPLLGRLYLAVRRKEEILLRS